MGYPLFLQVGQLDWIEKNETIQTSKPCCVGTKGLVN